jgi:hypothetical protein
MPQIHLCFNLAFCTGVNDAENQHLVADFQRANFFPVTGNESLIIQRFPVWVVRRVERLVKAIQQTALAKSHAPLVFRALMLTHRKGRCL